MQSRPRRRPAHLEAVSQHWRGYAMDLALSILWLLFTILFAILGRFFWMESRKSFPPFELTPRRGASWGTVEILGTSLDKPLEDFAAKFNAYLQDQNSASVRVNRAAAYSSLLAAATSLASAAIAGAPVILARLSR